MTQQCCHEGLLVLRLSYALKWTVSWISQILCSEHLFHMRRLFWARRSLMDAQTSLTKPLRTCIDAKMYLDSCALMNVEIQISAKVHFVSFHARESWTAEMLWNQRCCESLKVRLFFPPKCEDGLISAFKVLSSKFQTCWKMNAPLQMSNPRHFIYWFSSC